MKATDKCEMLLCWINDVNTWGEGQGSWVLWVSQTTTSSRLSCKKIYGVDRKVEWWWV